MRWSAIAAALALSAVLAAPARAEVDVEVPATFKAKGTLAGDADTYRFRGFTGSVLTLKAAAAKGADLGLSAELRDPLGFVVDPGSAAVSTGAKIQWKQVVLPRSGEYVLTLGAVGTGDYALAVGTKLRTAWSAVLDLSVEDTDSFDLAAPAGSLLAFRAAPSSGSACNPVIQSLTAGEDDIPVVETVKGTVHTATAGPLPVGGDMYASIFNDSANAGTAEVSVKVKPPKARPGKFDLRGIALGRPTGGETLVGRMLGGSGGTVQAEDEAGDLFGASVTFPSGALAGPTLVTLASTPTPTIGDPDDQAAGPAVDFGPSGVVFGAPAVITLPVDPALIPADADITDVRILIVEDDGAARIEFPTGFNAGSVTVETTGFSVCCPIVESGPPALGLNPGGDEFWILQFEAGLNDGIADSRGRQISAHVDEVSFFGDGTFQLSQEKWEFSWQNQDSPPMSGNPISPGLARSTAGGGATLSWAYDASGRYILLSGAPEALPTFRMSRDGRYLAGRHDAFDAPRAEVQFGVRKNTAPITAASVQGTWTCVFLEMDAGTTPSTGAAEPKPTRGTGTFVFDGTGGCSISVSQKQAEFNASNNTFAQPTESFSVPNATYAVDLNGTVVISIPPIDGDDEGAVLRAYPGAGLQVMLCAHDSFANDAAMGMVLVRQGTGLSKASLGGEFHGAEFGTEPQSYTTSPPSNVNVADFECRDQGVAAAFDGGATASFSFDTHTVRRDADIPSGVFRGNAVETVTAGLTVSSQGKFTFGNSGGKATGAVSADGQFFVAVSDLANAGGHYSMVFAFRAPPDKSP